RVRSERKGDVKCSNCDETHIVVCSSDGKFYERWTTAAKKIFKPSIYFDMAFFPYLCRLVKELGNHDIVQVACGDYHSMALSKGSLFCALFFSKWKLHLTGLFRRECLNYIQYDPLVCFFTYKDGLVCTFGAGGAGQLGHNSTRNELTPRVVAELWGARVSHVACGRQHTLVYVPSLDKVYSFGSYEGQLGSERKANQLIPLPIDLPVDNEKFCQGNDRCRCVRSTLISSKSGKGEVFAFLISCSH
ncbi:UNVERIFIED_CONTAM: hypothetical protein H355_012403, partial [Colinus virginianus]